MVKSSAVLIVVLMLALSACGSDDPVRPSQTQDHTLVGTWDLIGYSDHGVAGETTGSAIFGSDGTFVIDGTVTYPGETTDAIYASGTYQVMGSTLVLNVLDGTSSWDIEYFGDLAILIHVGSVPATTMTLKRQS
jgi:hypothetical protein